MLQFYKDYINRLDVVHNGIKEELAKLPKEALDWAPGKEMNSITVLVYHLTGAERFWIGDVATGETSHRNRAAEFQQSGMDAAALVQRLDQTLDYSKQACERLTLEDLGQERIDPRNGKPSTVADCLLHALEHAATHMGHIQLTRQLWEQHKH